MSNIATLHTEAALPVPQVDATTSWLALIERAVRDPALDVSKVERLFEMQERVAARQAATAYSAAMAACQADLEPVIRRSHNEQTRSKYASLDAIAEQALPVINKHGFGLSFSTDQSALKDHYGIVCRITHRDGHNESARADIPIDAAGLKGNANKTATHAFGSTMSYGRRYVTLMAFNITTRDDVDGNRPRTDASQTITAEQQAELSKLIAETGADLAKFLEFGKVTALSEIPAASFVGAKAVLLAKKAKQAKGASGGDNSKA